MSEYVGEAFVKITPDARGFNSELDKQIAQTSPRVQGALQRTGLDKSLKEYDATARESIKINSDLAAAEAIAATQAANLAHQHENVAVHAHRASVAGFAVRGSTVALGAGVLIAAEATKALAEGLRVTGAEAGTTEGRFRNFGAGILSGDVIGAMKSLTTEFTLTDTALSDLQHTIQQGDFSKLQQLADIAQQLGDKQLSKQIVQAQATVRATGIADQGTAASLTPGLRDDLAAARRAEAEARIGIRVFEQGTAEYSKAFAEYAEAVKQRRQVQQEIEKQAGTPNAQRDSRFQLNVLRANQTKTTADDRAIAEGRKTYLQAQIKHLEDQGSNTAAARARLTTLYGQLDSVEGQLVDLDKKSQQSLAEKVAQRFAIASAQIQLQSANARTDSQEISALNADAELNRKTAATKGLDKQTQLGYLVQAAQDDKQVYSLQQAAAEQARQAAEEAKRAAEAKKKQLEEERRQAAERAAQQRQIVRSTLELRLQNATAAAGLTKSTADDKTAINAQIRYYRNLVRTTRGLQQEQARATVIGLRGQLQGISQNESNAPRSSASDFFKEAASQFRSQGSNISTAGGILSGQDARAAFAARALSSGNIATTMAQQAQQTRNASLVEAQKQTALLGTIANRLTYGGATREPPAKAIANARRGAHVVASAV